MDTKRLGRSSKAVYVAFCFVLQRYGIYCTMLIGFLLGVTGIDLQPIQTSIDSSYTYIHNSMILGTFNQANPVVTYGPLGFIIHVLDLQYLKPLAMSVNGIIGAAAAGLLYLLLRSTHRISLGSVFLYAVVGTYLVSVQIFEWKLFAAYIVALTLCYTQKTYKLLPILMFVASCLLYAKLSLGIACLIILSITLICMRPGLRVYVQVIAVGIISTLGVGTVVFQSCKTALAYLYNGIVLTSGYSSAMSMQPANWEQVTLFLVLGLMGSIFVMYHNMHAAKGLLIAYAAGLFLVFKAGVTRQDPYGHVEAIPYFMAFLLCLAFIVYIIRRNNSKQPVLYSVLAILSVGLVFWGAHLDSYSLTRVRQTVINPLTFWKVESCTLGPCKNEDTLLLDDSILKIIPKSATVDIYPWENLVAYKNNLHWQPRPAPASYSALTPELDDADKEFFASKQAPDFIVWNVSEGVFGIDGRHMFFDEPATFATIVRNYDMVVEKDQYLVLKHKRSGNLAQYSQSVKQSLAWGQWYALPKDVEHGLTKIYYEPDMRQKLGSVLFRPQPINLEAKKKDGTTMTFRMVPENASQGILMESLPFNNEELKSVFRKEPVTNPVTEIRVLRPEKGSMSISTARF